MILLDTVALIRLTRNQSLSGDAVTRIRAAEAQNALYLSAVSAWELCLLETTGHTGGEIGGDGAAFLARAQNLTLLQIIVLDARIAIESRRLPGVFHKDPADRFIVATARILGLSIVTTDSHILDYAASGNVRAIAC
ncbi:MAG: type II toxin-antitoxin system VapC family toxin [Sphingomonadaceae bacterium]